MIDQLQLPRDVCLVLLAPTPSTHATSGLLRAHAITPVVCYGRVLRTGPRVRDVARGDLVAFPPSAGDPYAYRDYQLLFVHEREIAFVLTPTEKDS